MDLGLFRWKRKPAPEPEVDVGGVQKAAAAIAEAIHERGGPGIRVRARKDGGVGFELAGSEKESREEAEALKSLLARAPLIADRVRREIGVGHAELASQAVDDNWPRLKQVLRIRVDSPAAKERLVAAGASDQDAGHILRRLASSGTTIILPDDLVKAGRLAAQDAKELRRPAHPAYRIPPSTTLPPGRPETGKAVEAAANVASELERLQQKLRARGVSDPRLNKALADARKAARNPELAAELAAQREYESAKWGLRIFIMRNNRRVIRRADELAAAGEKHPFTRAIEELRGSEQARRLRQKEHEAGALLDQAIAARKARDEQRSLTRETLRTARQLTLAAAIRQRTAREGGGAR
ncbi:hypothetical protein HYS54_03250, partial [Candidatus Micrarchaeota archaeon]|nr:hypothetical protein [Candidatus Micrarchaeota archaeon]